MARDRMVQPGSIRRALAFLFVAAVAFCFYRFSVHDRDWLADGFTLTVFAGGQVAMLILTAPPPTPRGFWKSVAVELWRHWKQQDAVGQPNG